MRKPIKLAEWGRGVLRPAREAHNLTRRQLAEKTGIAESTLRNVETGRHQPQRAIVNRLCVALGLVNPLGGAVLTIEIGHLPSGRALDLITDALALLERTRGSQADAKGEGVDGTLDALQAASDAEDAADLREAIQLGKEPRR